MAHKAVMIETNVFLENFLKDPAQSSDKPPTRGRGFNPFRGLKDAAKMKESKISRLFVKAVNDHSLAPNMKMALSENHPDKGDTKKLRIDSAFYRPASVPTDKRPHWEDQIVSVEFKANGSANDPYDDRKPGQVDALAESRKQVRGQIIQYAEQAFEYRHRTSLILLIIIGRRFRFSRWDRSGTIVTPAVDYVKKPRVLCEMLWYMGRLSDEALGLDPSASRVARGSHHHRLMLMASLPVTTDADHSAGPLKTPLPEDAVFRYVRDKFRQSLDPEFPYYRLEVPYNGRMRSFLVGRPAFRASGMAGRGTTGYVAYDIETGKLVWLKDAWRTHYEFVDQEGSVLRQLNTAGVANVPTVVCHGDILDQETVTPTWWERTHPKEDTAASPVDPIQSSASSSRTLVNPLPAAAKGSKRSASEMDDDENGREDCPLRRHKHYRLVVEEVGLKLVDFQDGRQLLRIVFDCVTAHKEAVTKASIMHRDVSGGNILILPRVISHQKSGNRSIKWSGLLVDWELSKPMIGRAALPRPRQPERTGTWQFMSIAVLNDHGKEIEISDELESFFYVTLYYAVRYLESNCSDVGAFIEDFFDTYGLQNDAYKCGATKATAMQNGVLEAGADTLPLQFDTDIDKFFDKIMRWFKAQHAVQRYELSLRLLPTAKPPGSKLKGGFASRMTEDEYDEYEGFGDEEEEQSQHDQSTASHLKSSSQLVQEPSALERQDALKLTTHDAFLNALATALKVAVWPLDRVVGDNVPATYTPRVPVAPPAGASRVVKRMKMSAQTWAPGVGPDTGEGRAEIPLVTMR